jgi:hypothetical protein
MRSSDYQEKLVIGTAHESMRMQFPWTLIRVGGARSGARTGLHLIILAYHSCQLCKKTSVRFCFGGPTGASIVGAERKNFENMESLDRWKWHFQSLLYLIHTSFGSFYLDIQNHIVEYPRGCMKSIFGLIA